MLKLQKYTNNSYQAENSTFEAGPRFTAYTNHTIQQQSRQTFTRGPKADSFLQYDDPNICCQEYPPQPTPSQLCHYCWSHCRRSERSFCLMIVYVTRVINNQYIILTHTPPRKQNFESWWPREINSSAGCSNTIGVTCSRSRINYRIGPFWENQFFVFWVAPKNFFETSKAYLALEISLLGGGSYF